MEKTKLETMISQLKRGWEMRQVGLRMSLADGTITQQEYNSKLFQEGTAYVAYLNTLENLKTESES